VISRFYIAFVLFAGVALAYGANLLIAPASKPTLVGEVATPNHDPHPVRLADETVATPNHDPNRAALMQVAGTPNHDPRPVGLMPIVVPTDMTAWEPAILRAEPATVAPSAPVFVAADKMLYAKANARLRAAPSTASGVVVKLAADAPLRAIARSTDGVWWQVSLPGPQQGRTGYVHRDAVTKYRLVKEQPAAPTVPVAVADVFPQPVPAQGSRDLFGRVTEAMNWLADRAGPGPAPKVIRTER